ncbi:hypothetical protein [Haloferula sp.]|uniref:hypothetical protein n=1 Tax=Haloferula sp. TaxID=2497595 RepID=UPI003C75E1BE
MSPESPLVSRHEKIVAGALTLVFSLFVGFALIPKTPDNKDASASEAIDKGVPPPKRNSNPREEREKTRADGDYPNDLIAIFDKDPQAAYEKLVADKGRLTEPEFKSLQAMILSAWAEADPKNGKLLLSEESDPYAKSALVFGISQGILLDDIESVYDWLSSLDGSGFPEGSLDGAKRNIILRHSAEDPIGAAQVLDKLTSPELKAGLFEQVAGLYSRANFPEAFEWVKGQQNGDLREKGLRWIAANVPAEGFDQFSAEIADNPSAFQAELLKEMLFSLSEYSPTGMAAKIKDYPTSYQPIAAKALAEGWLPQDTDAATKWFAEQTDKDIHDAGAEVIANYLSYDHPVQAIDWALAMDDIQKRSELVYTVIARSNEVNRVGINQHLNSLGLSQDELDYLKSANQ